MPDAFYKNLIVPIRDFIYPPLCFICSTRLENGDERVCSECWSSFPAFKLGDPVWHELKDRFARSGAVSGFLSCFYFEGEGKLQTAIHLLKYQGMKSIGVMLGKEIGERMRGNSLFTSACVLVPVPLHRLKQRERGFNQSEFICKGISLVSGIHAQANVLRRFKYTQSQTQLSLEERQRNVGDAFSIDPRCRGAIRGKRFLLVDDVITTGATIHACALELVRAGAQSVFAASAAVAR